MSKKLESARELIKEIRAAGICMSVKGEYLFFGGEIPVELTLRASRIGNPLLIKAFLETEQP